MFLGNKIIKMHLLLNDDDVVVKQKYYRIIDNNNEVKLAGIVDKKFNSKLINVVQYIMLVNR